MLISEIFHSVQGEGKLTGVPSVFVRVSGCNLRCSWCDTPYASWHPEGREMPLDQIVARVRSYKCRHVVLTGGEPMIMPDVAALASRMLDFGAHLTIETAGTIFKPVPAHLMSISPKLSSSTPPDQQAGGLAVQHERRRLNIPALQLFLNTAPGVQLKFVVDRRSDLGEIDSLLGELRHWHPDDVLLMPQGVETAELMERSQWLIEACKERGFRFCPRLHVMVWGKRRGV
jgi:7-carboxy-7-deazaguanine synthase